MSFPLFNSLFSLSRFAFPSAKKELSLLPPSLLLLPFYCIYPVHGSLFFFTTAAALGHLYVQFTFIRDDQIFSISFLLHFMMEGKYNSVHSLLRI